MLSKRTTSVPSLDSFAQHTTSGSYRSIHVYTVPRRCISPSDFTRTDVSATDGESPVGFKIPFRAEWIVAIVNVFPFWSDPCDMGARDLFAVGHKTSHVRISCTPDVCIYFSRHRMLNNASSHDMPYHGPHFVHESTRGRSHRITATQMHPAAVILSAMPIVLEPVVSTWSSPLPRAHQTRVTLPLCVLYRNVQYDIGNLGAFIHLPLYKCGSRNLRSPKSPCGGLRST